jgi:hypothetical protein
MDTATYMLRLAGGETFGPADLATLCEWARQGRVPREAELLPQDGGPPRPVLAVPSLAAIVSAPPTVAGPRPPRGDATGGLIPYQNPPALVGYYLSIASLLPILGTLLGPAAMVLGVMGLKRRRRTPEVRGSAHAWIAIVLGAVGLLISGGCIGAMIMGRLS